MLLGNSLNVNGDNSWLSRCSSYDMTPEFLKIEFDYIHTSRCSKNILIEFCKPKREIVKAMTLMTLKR